jgi:Subtilase family
METPYKWMDVGVTSAGFDASQDWPVDPYWIWAEISKYASFQTGDNSYPVIFELAVNAIEGGSDREREAFAVLNLNPLNMIYSTSKIDQSHLTPAYSKFGTCIVGRDKLSDFVKLVGSGVVERYQLCVGRSSKYDSVSFQPSQSTRPESGTTVKVVGLIDDGFPIANAAFRPVNNNAIPVISLWDQSTPSGLPINADWKRSDIINYGSDISAADIVSITGLKGAFPEGEIFEREMYKQLDRPNWGDQGRTHGAGVLHMASAPLSATDEGFSAVLVQLPTGTVKDTSGGSLARYVLDGVRYIYWRAREFSSTNDLQLAINVSFGSIAGPHDGTTILEKALDELCDNPFLTAEAFKTLGLNLAMKPIAPKINVVLAAGNTVGKGIHGMRAVSKRLPGKFWLMVPARNSRESYLELWIPAGAALEKLSFTVTPPGAAASSYTLHCKVGQTFKLQRPDGSVLAGAIFAKRVCQSDGTIMQTMFLLSIAATDEKGASCSAPFGIWLIEVLNDEDNELPIHGWVERNDNVIGVRTAQQARLIEDRDSSNKYLLETSTLSSIANGSKTHIAGAYCRKPEMESKYSGMGPVIGGALQKFFYGPADESLYSSGISIPGFFSGSFSTMSGTSIAAPQVTRSILDDSIRTANAIGTKPTVALAITSAIRKGS